MDGRDEVVLGAFADTLVAQLQIGAVAAFAGATAGAAGIVALDTALDAGVVGANGQTERGARGHALRPTDKVCAGHAVRGRRACFKHTHTHTHTHTNINKKKEREREGGGGQR